MRSGNQGVKIGGKKADLFEVVAGEFDLSRKIVSEYYYFWKSNFYASHFDIPELIKPLIQPRAMKGGRSK